MSTETIEWIPLPVPNGGRGRGTPIRAMATLERHPSDGSRLRVTRIAHEAIGAPERVDVLIDKARGRFALRPSDTGRSIYPLRHRGQKEVNFVEMSATGISDALGLAGRQGSVRMRVAAKNGMILMEPIAPPIPCASCSGTGVSK